MIMLNEGLEEVADGVFCTDYAGDVANLLVNKPKPYRFIYDEDYDVYIIADAEKYVHYQLAKMLVSSGYMYKFRDFEDNMREETIKRQMKYKIPASAMSIENVYASMGNKIGFIFIPGDYSLKSFEEKSFYRFETPITTGTIYTTSDNELSVFCRDLYNKLKSLGALL